MYATTRRGQLDYRAASIGSKYRRIKQAAKAKNKTEEVGHFNGAEISLFAAIE